MTDILKEIKEGEQIGAISMMMAGNVASAILERDSRILLMREEIIRLNAALAEARVSIVDVKTALEEIQAERNVIQHKYDKAMLSIKSLTARGEKDCSTVEAYRVEVEKLTKDRDSWKSEYDMYWKAWSRELGNVFPKTHLIDSLVLTTKHIVSENKKLGAFKSALTASNTLLLAVNQCEPLSVDQLSKQISDNWKLLKGDT